MYTQGTEKFPHVQYVTLLAEAKHGNNIQDYVTIYGSCNRTKETQYKSALGLILFIAQQALSFFGIDLVSLLSKHPKWLEANSGYNGSLSEVCANDHTQGHNVREHSRFPFRTLG